MRVLAVALAGAAGALSRYGIGVAVGVRSFPWATLGINIVGSFLLGLLLVEAIGHRLNETLAIALAVGFLGAFTTFSTFSYETWTLLHTHREGMALLYVGLSVVIGIAAAAAGYAVGRAAT